jgi:hypothetical protein
MKKTLRDRIDELAAMDVKALQAEHEKLFGQPSVSAHRQYLFRKLAWQVQAEEQGGRHCPTGSAPRPLAPGKRGMFLGTRTHRRAMSAYRNPRRETSRSHRSEADKRPASFCR